MDVVTIDSLAAFIKLIEDTCLDQSVTLFRGQSRDFPLLPSIARQRLTDDILVTERAMLEEFQRHSVPFLRVVPVTLWEWIALAQHHGLPTRLLDWSSNPLASLWFAVERPPLDGGHGVVWILRPSDEDFADEADKNSLACERHKVFAPKHITERITAQVAWFTVYGGWSRRSEVEPLEVSPEFGAKLTKVSIPAERFAHLRFHLDRCGINHSSVFPGLDGLCSHIRWRNIYLADEGDTA